MKILSLTCTFTLTISSYGFIDPLTAIRKVEEGQNKNDVFWNRELWNSSKKGKSGKSGKKNKSGSNKGKSGKPGGKRRDLEILEQDSGFFIFDNHEDAEEYHFFDRELYNSSKKGKSGKSGKNGKSGSNKGRSGKAGGKRRDLEIVETDASFFVADKDVEGQFFDRELYYSSKKGKLGKSAKKGKSGSTKGKSGKAGGKRRDLEILEENTGNFVADKDVEDRFFERELYYSSKKGKSGKSGKKSESGSNNGKSGKSGGKRRDLEIVEPDTSFFIADKDVEGQFFDRELYYSSKKVKSGKSGKKGKSGSNKGKSGKAGGKRRDLEILEENAGNFVADKDVEDKFFERELYYSSRKGKSGKSGKKGKSGSNNGKSGKSGGKRRDLEIIEQDADFFIFDKDIRQ